MVFNFDRPLYMVMENDREAIIVVTKNGSSDYPRTIRLIGVVENGVDITEDLVFNPGQTMMGIRAPLVDDEVALEAPVQYSLSLEVPTGQPGVALGGQANSALEVADDDGKPTFQNFVVCYKLV